MRDFSKQRSLLRTEGMSEADLERIEQRRNAMVKQMIIDRQFTSSTYGVLIPENAQPRAADVDYAYDEDTGEQTLAEANYKEKETKVVAEIVKANCKKSKSRDVQIFDMAILDQLKANIKQASSDHRVRITASIEAAARNGGRRTVPMFKNLHKKMTELKLDFDNFSEFLDQLEEDLVLAAASVPDSFRVTPTILVGPPGIGKTELASRLGAALGVKTSSLDAGSLTHPGQLCGTAQQWGNSSQGDLIQLLINSDSAVNIFVLDECEKLARSDQAPIVPALLHALEVTSAKRYVDVSLGIQFDFSKSLVILTANTVETIDPPLKSRCRVYHVELPGKEQKRRAAIGEHKKVNAALARGKRTELDLEALDKLIGNEIDMRTLISAVRKSCAVALRTSSRIATPVFSVEQAAAKNDKRRSIGFSNT